MTATPSRYQTGLPGYRQLLFQTLADGEWHRVSDLIEIVRTGLEYMDEAWLDEEPLPDPGKARGWARTDPAGGEGENIV